MVTQSWLYDSIIYIYALSLLFSFSDLTRVNQSAKRMGTGLLLFVWVLQTAYLAYGLYSHRVQFVFTMFETLFMFSWVLVTLSLVVQRFMRIDSVVFFVNVFGFAVLALNFFSNPKVTPSFKGWHIADELLFIHISLAMISYAAFSLAALLSGSYLFLHRRLKEKQWTNAMKRLPSLESIDRYTYVAVITGMPLLLLSLSLGIVWVVLHGDDRLLADPKVLNSIFILGAYGIYVTQRQSFRLPGYRLAYWNLGAFSIVLVNFVVSNLVSRFHQWIWM